MKTVRPSGPHFENFRARPLFRGAVLVIEFLGGPWNLGYFSRWFTGISHGTQG